ncbi:hypothetical protein, partial [Bradyrhizobium sp.]|uniref:hypothetical protein n=1 Tax=Bradyrhizobium sp. TaxID=376 RepID=UPI003C78F4D7
MIGFAKFCRERNLREPPGLWPALIGVAQSLEQLIYWPDGDAARPNSLAWGVARLDEALMSAPSNLLPLLPADEASIACAVLNPLSDYDELSEHLPSCEVVRWHLGDIDPAYQGALLDSDVEAFLASIAREFAERPRALQRVKSRAARYYQDYVSKGEQPRKFIQRPIQLACQNVIIGLATIQHDSSFDSLRVGDYLSCEASHLATHESDRGMTALLLCDAFRSGGTMEIRFGPAEREKRVPAALERFGRSLGIPLGSDDPNAITPAEARALFQAVTPMPDDLRSRTAELFDRGIIAPERFCFTLMSSIFSAIELDYILATSSRTVSILQGGSSAEFRRARLAELETCRASLMLGMLFRRLTSRDNAAGSSGAVRIFEDAADSVSWRVHEETAIVVFDGIADRAPWQSPDRAPITLA